MIKKFFRYIENFWIGADKKPSLRAALAIAFSIDFIHNLSHAIWKWDAGRSLEGLSLVLGIEAGLIVSLLGITAWNNVSSQKISAESTTTEANIQERKDIRTEVRADAGSVNVVIKGKDKEEPNDI